jgi:hypothetical protein
MTNPTQQVQKWPCPDHAHLDPDRAHGHRPSLPSICRPPWKISHPFLSTGPSAIVNPDCVVRRQRPWRGRVGAAASAPSRGREKHPLPPRRRDFVRRRSRRRRVEGAERRASRAGRQRLPAVVFLSIYVCYSNFYRRFCTRFQFSRFCCSIVYYSLRFKI